MKNIGQKTRMSTRPKSPVIKKHTLNGLLDIMAKLRSPSGCPWDREQSEHTLKKYLIEESYEVLEAIEAKTPGELQEELGDLLLQIIFLSRIAEEKGQFSFLDIVHQLAQKLIRRHPHVFPTPGHPSVKPKTAQEVLQVWGDVKESEGKYAKRRSLLDGIPLALPALERARRISDRVSRVGFDWPDIEGVWEKIGEELAELRKAEKGSSPQAVEEELGDLLFSLVNLGRFKGISAEGALRRANRRFAKRFSWIEQGLRRRGHSLKDSTLEEMDELWNQAKIRAKSKERRAETKKGRTPNRESRRR